MQHALVAATRFEWAQLVAAVFAVVAAVAIPMTAYLRRPSVSLAEDSERVYPRLEVDVPFVRLIVRAKRFRRAAHGTRVEVIGVRRLDETKLTPLGHWPLGWTSAEPAAVTVYAGAERAIDFAVLQRYDPNDVPVIYGGSPQLYSPEPPRKWHLTLVLHGGLAPSDSRHRLAPGSWAVRLVVGTDDGDSRTYEVQSRGTATKPIPRAPSTLSSTGSQSSSSRTVPDERVATQLRAHGADARARSARGSASSAADVPNLSKAAERRGPAAS